MTPAEVDLRSDIARWLPPHKLPADRGTLLEFLQHEGAPDEVADAVGQPARPADVRHHRRDRPRARYSL